ncbi:MAG: hypothetical protein COA69_07730 [Robiginitomaculum sp.]|nr:MAG: hypothetical protein COA69_07730 [Robiginitomaculum sp.]
MTGIDQDTDQDSDQDTGTLSISERKFAALVMCGLVFVCLLTLFLIARSHVPVLQTLAAPDDDTKARTAYRRILGETHTGLRLARFEDFLVYYPDSSVAPAARIQYGVLQLHETRAWARLSETVYTLDVSIEDKTGARDRYLESWGQLLRMDQLKSLPLSDPPPPASLLPDALAYQASLSKYTGRVSSRKLAGGPKSRSLRYRRQNRDTYRDVYGQDVREARIRRARKPIYPGRAKRRGIQAIVVLNLDIDENGYVTDTHVGKVVARRYRSDFIRAARRAAERTRFHPRTIDGEPVVTRNFKRTYRFLTDT